MATSPEKWEAVKAWFDAALDLDADERSAFLRENCSDPEARAEVERLLAEHAEAGAFLSTPMLGNFSVEAEKPPYRFLPGELLAGRFRIIHYIAGGGMGEVYEAEDQELREHVAVKTIRPEILRQPGAVVRFKREVHLARKVTHPNVCRIFDLFRHKSRSNSDEIVFVSMELLHGKTLADCLKEDGRMSMDTAMPLIKQMVAALRAAHAAGIVHRDFKPGNVVLVPTQTGEANERAVITDFGLALQSVAPADGPSFSTGSSFLGTPAYMAPEQVEGRPATPASDIYALGLVMYEMATGTRPFQGDTPISAAMKRLSEAPAPPRRIQPGVNSSWEAVILRCLERDPTKRFLNAEDLARALEGSLSGARFAWQKRSVWRKPGTWVAASLIVAVVGAAVLRFRGHPLSLENGGLKTPVRRSVAVLGFKNLSGRPEISWISTALSEELTAELAAGAKLRTISGENVARVKTDMALPDTDSLSGETLSKLHRSLGTDIVVLGSYLDVGDQLRVDLQVQDANAGQTIATISETASEAHILELVNRVGNKLREDCGAGDITSEQAKEVKASQPSSAEATRLYSEGLERLRVFDALSARKLLEAASASDPGNALIHSSLAAAWAQLGYDRKARNEAERAFDLSSELSREDRLWIEGGYRLATKDWQKAIDVYHTLFTFFPDSLEYGLNLASAETAGGRAKDALNTLGALRKLQAPAGEDPRIDLAAARAYAGLSDFQNSLAAANRVSNQAPAAGTRLLAAQGLRARGFALKNLGQLDEGMKSLQGAVELYKEAGDRDGMARALGLIGNILSDQGNLAQAEAPYRQELAIAQEIGDQMTIGNVLTDLGNLAADQGNYSKAQDQYNQALTIYQEVRDSQKEASERFNLATLFYQRGNYRLASSQFESSLKTFRELGMKTGMERTLSNYGELLYREGELDKAKATYEEGLKLASEIGYKRGLGFCTTGIGEVLLAKGDIPGAQKKSEESLKIGTELGDKVRIARAHLLMSESLLEAGHAAEAEALVQQAATDLGAENKNDPGTAVLLAISLLDQGKLADAQLVVDEMKKNQPKLADPLQVWQIQIAEARVSSASGNSLPAERELNSVIMEASKAGDRIIQFEARLALGELEEKSGNATTGRLHLAQLENDARGKGFTLIASKAKHARIGG